MRVTESQIAVSQSQAWTKFLQNPYAMSFDVEQGTRASIIPWNNVDQVVLHVDTGIRVKKMAYFQTIYDNGLGGFAPLDHQFWVRGEPVLVGGPVPFFCSMIFQMINQLKCADVWKDSNRQNHFWLGVLQFFIRLSCYCSTASTAPRHRRSQRKMRRRYQPTDVQQTNELKIEYNGYSKVW